MSALPPALRLECLLRANGGRRELWPADPRCGCVHSQHLSRSRPCNGADIFHTTPLRCYQKQCFAVRTAEHASETPAVQLDRLQHLTTFTDTHTAPVGDIGIPHSVLSIDADTIGHTATEIGPHTPIGQGSVCSYVEGCEPFAVRLGDD